MGDQLSLEAVFRRFWLHGLRPATSWVLDGDTMRRDTRPVVVPFSSPPSSVGPFLTMVEVGAAAMFAMELENDRASTRARRVRVIRERFAE